MRECLVDANILLRYLTNEPRDLADPAAALLERTEQSAIALVVAPLTLAEVVYVLESVYAWPRRDIALRLSDLIAASVFVVLELEVMAQTLALYRDTAALDFADAYVAALAGSRGRSGVMSFDRELRRVPGIRLIQDPADVPD